MNYKIEHIYEVRKVGIVTKKEMSESPDEHDE